MTTDSLPRRRTNVPTELIAATRSAFEVCKQYIFLNIQFNFKLTFPAKYQTRFGQLPRKKIIQLLQFFGIIFTKFHIVYAFSRKIYFCEKMQKCLRNTKENFCEMTHFFSKFFVCWKPYFKQR